MVWYSILYLCLFNFHSYLGNNNSHLGSFSNVKSPLSHFIWEQFSTNSYSNLTYSASQKHKFSSCHHTTTFEAHHLYKALFRLLLWSTDLAFSSRFLVQIPMLDNQLLPNDIILCTGLSALSYFHRKLGLLNFSSLCSLYWYPLREDGKANSKLYFQTEIWALEPETLCSLSLGTTISWLVPKFRPIY
jgi:hypothetical protein